MQSAAVAASMAGSAISTYTAVRKDNTTTFEWPGHSQVTPQFAAFNHGSASGVFENTWYLINQTTDNKTTTSTINSMNLGIVASNLVPANSNTATENNSKANVEVKIKDETDSIPLDTSVDVESGKRMFHCPSCQYKTPNRSRVQEHLFTHTNERPFKCTLCDFETRRNRDLKRHMLTHNSYGTEDLSQKVYECNECDYRTSLKRRFRNHKLSHSNNQLFECTECDYKTTKKHDLKRHQQTHTSQKPFECLMCGYKSRRKSDLNRHMLTHTDQKPPVVKIYECSICEFTSTQSEVVRSHMAAHQGETHEIGSKNVQTAQVQYFKRVTNSEPSIIEHLKRENESSNSSSSSKSEYCDNYEVIPMEWEMGEEGMMEKKWDINNMVPTRCETTVDMHSGKQTYHCTQCDYKATLRNRIREHMMVHTGEKPYKCQQCNYETRRYRDLKRHTANSACGATTGTSNLRECPKCDYKTEVVTDLNTHMKQHRSEKLFACLECDYTTTRRHDLKRHMNTHKKKSPVAHTEESTPSVTAAPVGGIYSPSIQFIIGRENSST
ncbi:unnamed protein product [Meganyctiphanes norvegica]|uniref:C2H2-type domain-containing protein n=1 Tax=Meganyctiphanes norvegica TaxID=48144 RepID=A0AAV2RET1_MEGNR